ncbi:hypothetical protein HDU98_010402 [Podochytrium sp. JEL0797]|nr:hypothetical protein HDU98_010402 [Podochytrium sp. JEL0797]
MPAPDRVETLLAHWNQVEAAGTPSSPSASGSAFVQHSHTATVVPLPVAILAAMRRVKAAQPHPHRVPACVNLTASYIGPQKQIHIHRVADLSVATSAAVTDPSVPLFFLQGAMPRNLQILNLSTYERIPLLFTEKKPFIFRILNWSHTPFVYFVDRDTYQRRMWFYDASRKALVPVVSATQVPPMEVEAAPETQAETASPAPSTAYTMIDPFAHVVDVEDAHVNDNVVGFGNVVVWWTWVGIRRPRPKAVNEDGEEVEEESEEEEEDEEVLNLLPGQPRPPRRYELKVHAYRVEKEADIEGHGTGVKVTTLWSHHIHLTSSQNCSAEITPSRFLLFHHKKLAPKNHAEIVAKYSFDLTLGGGLITNETIEEPIREHAPPAKALPPASDSQPTPAPLQFPPSSRTLVGSLANNQRLTTRFHLLEFHAPFDFFNPDGTPVAESSQDAQESDMLITGYKLPVCDTRVFTGRDPSLGKTVNTNDAVETPVANPRALLSLVPVVKNVWRPGKRQVSEDGGLLVVAGVEGSRRVLRVVDVAKGDIENKVVHAFYLDDETGLVRKKKVGGGVWVVELDDSERGWDVVFVECG